jgi:5,10-methylenetetrahydromethanopterin reductase
MEFGIGCPPKESSQSAEAIARTVQRAEDCGFNEAWIGDSQGIWHDLYVSMTLSAVRTRRIRLGAGVTNLVTRHPAVTARAMATLDEVSGGRAMLGFGAGDTAFKHLGLKPSSLKDLEEGIQVIRSLLAGEEATYQGNTIPRFTGFRPRNIPLYLACYGPKMLELAGRVADGVNVPVGLSAELIQYALDHIEKGVRATDRDPASVAIAFQVGCSIREDGDQAREDVKSWAARRALSPIPLSVLGLTPEEAEGFRKAYRYTDHLVPHAPHSAQVRVPWADSVSLAGTPEECIERLRALEERGIHQVILVPATQDSEELLTIFEKKVLPHFI